jgi:hypothetical protein
MFSAKLVLTILALLCLFLAAIGPAVYAAPAPGSFGGRAGGIGFLGLFFWLLSDTIA